MKTKGIQVIIFLVGLLLIELILRALGFQPYQYHDFSLKHDQPNYIVSDSLLGFNITHGHFKINSNGVIYEATHSASSLRQTIPETESKVKHGFFGCSYTYGWGVNDSETFCSLLQKETKAQIINFAKPGYGTIQGYYQLKNLIKKGIRLNSANFIFCDFHAERNVLSPTYATTILEGFSKNQKLSSSACFPVAELKENKLHIGSKHLNEFYSFLPLRKESAIINAIQTGYENFVHHPEQEDLISLLIFEEIANLCLKNNIQLNIFGITKNERTHKIINKLKEKGINACYIPVNFKDSKLSHLPLDSHPNKAGHQSIFNQLKGCFEM